MFQNSDNYSSIINVNPEKTVLIAVLFILSSILKAQSVAEIRFSANSGFYNTPFTVTITSPDPSARITYTLDGSNPQNSLNSFTVNSPTSVLIDPENSTGRPLTPGVVIRASFARQGSPLSFPALRTYLFTDKVRTQVWPGGSWPSWMVNNQQIDLEMDGKVVNDPDYSGLIDNALLSIPSISIATDLNNLFDPDSGIYVNADGRGTEWERECSVELVNPDHSVGFMVNAGLRIRGGASRGGSYPKHGFRLFFRSEYGNSKLDSPLFGNEGTGKFDKIDLRTDQDYAWSNGWTNSSFVREVFSRDSQRDLGQPYTRSRYCHLYLNGMYWGLYMTEERPEADYGSTYLGGKSEDYDVVKVKTDDWSYTIEATDGNLSSWQNLWEMCNQGFTDDKNFFRLEGKDEKGVPVKNAETIVNIGNLIDYMLVIFYTGNFDSPTSAFLNNKRPNNFYALDNRVDRSSGFTFFVHDAENAMMDEAIYPGEGLYEDRVSIGTRDDDMKMEVTGPEYFHPQWLHFRLSEDKEYRSRFADRAWQLLSDGGALSPGKSLERINKRISTIDMAVIAESARWGDAQTGDSYVCTRNGNWLPEIGKIRNNFIPNRTQIVIEQLRSAGLYPEIDAPVITGPDGIITEVNNTLTSSITVKIENPDNEGTLYYTTDGSDPRLPGGEVNHGASVSSAAVSFTINSSLSIKARVYSVNKWSALREVNFLKSQADYGDLKVTELNYHPPALITGSDTIYGKDLEFIEFKNTGKNPVNLSGLVLDSAVHYTFSASQMLPSQQFFVITSNPGRFYDLYGLVPSGWYSGNFSNSGEEVLLRDLNGKKIIDFSYDDSYPWPESADGEGYTLTAAEKNPSGNPADYHYWRQSSIKGGTPFADDPASVSQDTVKEYGLKVYPNPSTGNVTINFAGEDESARIEMWLYNYLGQPVLHTFASNSESTDLSVYDLPEGVYVLKASIKGKSGKTILILLDRK